MPATQQIIDNDRVGKKGCPRHFAAFGVEAPTKTVPVEDGTPQVDHPGLDPIDVFRLEIQAHLDARARERQYDSIQTAITYRDDPNPQYAAEGQALFEWRSNVWTYATEQLAKVTAGEREQPTVEEFIAELPPFTWGGA